MVAAHDLNVYESQKWLAIFAITAFVYFQPGGGRSSKEGDREYYRMLRAETVRRTGTLFWAPPVALFGIVWTILYGLMSAAIYMYWLYVLEGVNEASAQTRTLIAILVNLGLNKLWQPIFFGSRQILLAAIVAFFIFGTSLWTLLEFAFQGKEPSFWLWLPYTVWSLYAFALNCVQTKTAAKLSCKGATYMGKTRRGACMPA